MMVRDVPREGEEEEQEEMRDPVPVFRNAKIWRRERLVER